MGKGDEVSVALDMGSTPPTFPRVRFVEAAGGGEAHIRLEAELVWRGASLELTAQIGTDLTGYVAVPLALSELVVRGTLRFQAAPCGDAPYLGQCSVSFLSPPQIDFVLRPLRAFDVMEVPLLQRRLHAALLDAICAPMLWPQQHFFLWAELFDQPAPTVVTLHLHHLQPPADAAAAPAPVYLCATLSEKTYDQAYRSADTRVVATATTVSATSSAAAEAGLAPIHEEPTFLCEVAAAARVQLALFERRAAAPAAADADDTAADGGADGAEAADVGVGGDDDGAPAAPPSLAVVSAAADGRLGGDATGGDRCVGRAEVALASLSADAAAAPVEVTFGGWRLSASLALRAPPPPQHAFAAGVLHITAVSVHPPAPLRVRLRAAGWARDLPAAAEASWAPAALVWLARPGAQPLYVDIIGAEEAAPAPAPAADEAGATAAADGAAVARIDVSDVGDATTTRWAVVEPGGRLAVRVEVAVLRGAAAEWQLARVGSKSA